MSFNYSGSTFVSFASYGDVTGRDQRFFEANEGFTSLDVTGLLTQASQRILTQLRNTDWWKSYQFARDSSLNNDMRLLPTVNPDYIKAREQEFKDLNVYFALSEYLYPRVADFGNPESAEVVKIQFYRDAYNKLFTEVIESGDWYDFDEDGSVETAEKQPVKLNLIRVR